MGLIDTIKKFAGKIKDSGILEDKEAINQVAAYLSKFLGVSRVATDKEVADAIKVAQTQLGVTVDGIPGFETLKAMQTIPRCGCTDVQMLGAAINKWAAEQKNQISYNVVGYVTGLTQARQEEMLAASFENWEKVCGIQLIRRRSNNVNIVIDSSAARQEEFGDAGNVLAWAQLPQGPNFKQQLIMKFDLAERWSEDGDGNTISYPTVACHEIGHLLGLDHTQIQGELMYPMYNVNVPKPQSRYDIPEVQKRYGMPLNPGNGGGGNQSDTVTGTISINGKAYKLVPTT